MRRLFRQYQSKPDTLYNLAATMIVGDIAQSLFLAADLIFRRHCSIAQPDYKMANREFTRYSQRNLRENCSGRAQENGAVEILQTFPRVIDPAMERKSHFTTTTYAWRREWDSNPRYGFPYTRFPSVRLQPLGHPSAKVRAPARLRAKGARTIVAGGGVATRSRPPGTARSRPPIMAPDHGPQSRAHCRLFGL
jgi:hypothetical protein